MNKGFNRICSLLVTLLSCIVLLISGCSTENNEDMIQNDVSNSIENDSSQADPTLEVESIEDPEPTEEALVDLTNIRFTNQPFELNNITGGGPVTSVAFSPDDKYLAMAGFSSIRLISTKDLSIPYTLEGHQGLVTSLKWTDDQKYLISTDINGAIILWYSDDFTQARSLDSDPIIDMDISPDSKSFILGHEQGVVSIRDVGSGDILDTFISGSGSAVLSLRYSPDGSMIAAGLQSGSVEIWDVAEKGMLMEIGADKEESSAVASVAWSDDGRFLAFGYENSETYIIDAGDWSNFNIIHSDIEWVSNVAWLPNSHAITITGKGNSNTWDAATKEDLTGVGGWVDYFCADWSNNGRYLALGSGGSYFKLGAYNASGSKGYLITEAEDWYRKELENPTGGGVTHFWIRIDN